MGPIRILLVDDERNVLRSLERLFLEEEYEIFTATSGQEALETMELSGPFQLIVSDYRMPSMSGVEFLGEVYRRWPNTERLILSGYADTAAIVAAINKGHIYKFIAKPWDDDGLLQTVREALDRYKLRANNRRLLEKLTTANAELKTINDNLNTIVDERLKVAMEQNRALQSFQNILDAIPIGFVGADGFGIIAQCNRFGAEMLGVGQEELIGKELSEIFPAPLLQKIIDLPGNSCGDYVLALPDKRLRVHMTRLSRDGEITIVISLVIEP